MTALRPLMRELVRQMADHGFERNYRRAIVEGLDTSPEARWERANEQGWRLPQYHASRYVEKRDDPRDLFRATPRHTESFREFRPDGAAEMGIHSASDPSAAHHRIIPQRERQMLLKAGRRADLDDRYKNSYTMPLLMRTGDEVWTPDLGRFTEPDQFISRATRENFRFTQENPLDPPVTPTGEVRMPSELFEKIAYEARRRVAAGQYDATAWRRWLRKTLRDAGFDTVAYRNTVELVGDISRMGLDPNQYRSVNAMFNPKRKHKRDLLASLAAALTAALAAEGDDG